MFIAWLHEGKWRQTHRLCLLAEFDGPPKTPGQFGTFAIEYRRGLVRADRRAGLLLLSSVLLRFRIVRVLTVSFSVSLFLRLRHLHPSGKSNAAP